MKEIIAIAALAVSLHASAFRLVDASTKAVMPLAAITDRSGNVVGMTDNNGEIPEISSDRYPITFNSMGYEQVVLVKPATADVGMQLRNYELPEIVVTPGSRPLLHLTGYMRETSSVMGSSDSITMFRESIVDFLVPIEKAKVKGWDAARILASKTFVKIKNSAGLDSVSNRHEYEYMLWGDKLGLIHAKRDVPEAIKGKTFACDTIMGKYFPKIIWWKNGPLTRWYGDGLANEKNHTISPAFLKFFGLTTDFKDLSTAYVFNTPEADAISPADLKQASVSLNMLARGRLFKKAFDSSTPVNIKAYVEVYLTDREYLSNEEAKLLKKEPPVIRPAEIIAPADATPIHPAIRQIKDRVNAL